MIEIEDFDEFLKKSHKMVKIMVKDSKINLTDDNKKKIKYLNFLLKIYPLKKINMNIRELANQKHIPDKIMNKISHYFYKSVLIGERSVLTQTNMKKIKFLCYIIILSLKITKN